MNDVTEILRRNKKRFWYIGISVLICCLVCVINFFGGNWYVNISEAFYVVLFVVAEGSFGFLLIRNLRKKAAMVQVVCTVACMNLISVSYLFWHDRIFLDRWSCYLFAFIFLGVSLTGMTVLWKNRNAPMKKYIVSLVLGSIIIILNFAGIYDFLYNAYAPIGMESMSVQEKNENRWLFAEDFLWYSTEMFLGVDVSDVTIEYISYNDVIEDEISSLYLGQYERLKLLRDILSLRHLLRL